jgi:hypothetical protein
MENSIDFKGLKIDCFVTWSANNPDDVRIVVNETTGNKSHYKIFNSKPNGYTTPKTITVDYVKSIYDNAGELLAVQDQPKIVNTTYYDLFAQMELQGKQFDLQRRPELNAVLQVVCNDDRAIAFDPTNNFEPIQPIIYDVSVNDLEITVNNLSIDGAKTPEYSLDGVTWQDSNILTAADYGGKTVYVRYKTELYDFKESVNLVNPEIVE